MSKRVLIVDAKNVLYRMHYSHAGLKTSDGLWSGGLFGFFKEMLRLNEHWPDASMVFCWDGKGASWRVRKYPQAGYKANRKTPQMVQLRQAIKEQEATLKVVLGKLGFWNLEMAGVEADDLIGLLVGSWPNEDEIRIYSGDRDMLQLVGKNVMVWRKPKEEPVDEAGVETLWGVVPGQVPEIRAMAGDSSDNLKGLFKVGPKKALVFYQKGVRASQPWSKQSKEAQVLIEKWKEEWSRINVEYEMARIPRSTKEEMWEALERRALELSIDSITSKPSRQGKDDSCRRAYWLKFLGRYEMNELWRDRHRVFEIP